MSNVGDIDKSKAIQLESLRKRADTELNEIQRKQTQKKNDIEAQNTSVLVDINSHHEQEMARESAKKREILSQLKDNLDQTRSIADKELKELRKNNSQLKAKEKLKMAEERELTISEHDLQLTEMNDRFNKIDKNINYEGRNQIENRKDSLQGELNQADSFYKNKLGTQHRTYSARIKQEGDSFEKLKNEQETKFKQDRLTHNQKQQLALNNLTEQHSTHTEKRSGEFKKELSNQDLAFEQKYAEHMKTHQENMKRLNEQNEKIMTEMKNGVTKKIQVTAERSSDPFYQFTELDPVLNQYPDRVEVKVKIPEHSKQDLQLTTNNKEIILNFNRRYDDSHSPNKGVVNKLHKVESYTTRLTSDSALDPKTVKSHFEGGIMTYTINRA